MDEVITQYLNNINPAIRAGLNYARAVDGKIKTVEDAMQAALAAGRNYRAIQSSSQKEVRRIPDRTPRIGIPTTPRTTNELSEY